MSRDKRKYSDRRDYLINAVTKRRKKIRQLAIEFKGGKCEVCGYDRCSEVLEFHHLDSSKKDFGISLKGYTRGWKRVKEELKKCVLLCANCHREVHAGILQLSQAIGIEKVGEFREACTLEPKWSRDGNPEPSPDIMSGKVQRLSLKKEYCKPTQVYGKRSLPREKISLRGKEIVQALWKHRGYL